MDETEKQLFPILSRLRFHGDRREHLQLFGTGEEECARKYGGTFITLLQISLTEKGKKYVMLPLYKKAHGTVHKRIQTPIGTPTGF